MSPIWLLLPVALIMVFAAGRIGVTRSSFVDTETASENVFQAWASSLWTQTTQIDFEAGIVCQVSTANSSNNVILAESGPSIYFDSGNITSQVLDTDIPGAVCNVLSWDETIPVGTDITFEVRASEGIFLEDAVDPAWISVGSMYPVVSGLPTGRYMQWRATLTTSNTAVTPILHEVRVYYY